MKSVAIITARGGSKRIPRKNIKEFCGKPIIAYSITAALESGCFDEVMVSTDDTEIADIAKSFGAVVPFYRNDATSGDFSGTTDVLKEVIDKYAKENIKFDYLCCIYPTAPFITAKRLKQAMDTLVGESASSVIPVVQFSFPPQRAVIIKDGCIVPQYPEYISYRSQDLEKIYHDCGQFYALKVADFLKDGIIGKKSVPIVLDELEVQDIDNETDWKLAELKYKTIQGMI